ncbi:hypothetical protein [Sphingobacterium populi]|uniref:hypothetical protein n=1 Tax=Sphingobacterium sp. CFCC 11742 TaxID=1775560 RepID=UPI000ACF10E4|nr:hypothetical protein [Sphingobacterium sp. CFCC 11742]
MKALKTSRQREVFLEKICYKRTQILVFYTISQYSDLQNDKMGNSGFMGIFGVDIKLVYI